MLAKGEIFLRVVGLSVKRFLDWVEDVLKPTAQGRAVIYSMVGKKCVEKGQVDEAIASLKSAIELDPSDVEVHCKLGLAYSKKKSWEDAIASYQKALDLDAGGAGGSGVDRAEIHYGLAVCYDKTDEVDAAIRSCKESLKISSENPEVHFRLGFLCDKKKKHDQSIKAYKRALELDPRKAKYYYSLGLAYDANGKHNDAIDSFRKAMEAEEAAE